MGVDVASIDGMLKEVYDSKAIEKLFNEEAVTLKRIRKSTKKPSGKGLRSSVNVKGNERGQGSQNELEALRTPGNQVTKEWKVLPKIFTHTVRFSGLSLDTASGDEDAYADTLTYETEEGLRDSAKELNAQIFRDGSGRLAQVNGAVVNNNVITFDNGIPTHLREGIFIDAFNGNVKEIDSIEITELDIANNQITLASNVNVSNNSFIYREDVNDNAPADGKEIAGLPLVTDDGTISATYQDLSRATFPRLNGITFDALGANVSNDLLQRMISRVKIASNGKMPNKVISNTSQMRKYLDILVPLKRFDSKEKMDSGYVEVPTWNGKEWIEETDCGFDEIYMISDRYIERAEIRALDFDKTDGKMLKWDGGYDAYKAYAKAYMNLYCQVPNAHVRIKNLAVPTY